MTGGVKMNREEAIAEAAAMLASGTFGKTAAVPVDPGRPGSPWKIQYTTGGKEPREGEIS
jgi:hypothetical protein